MIWKWPCSLRASVTACNLQNTARARNLKRLTIIKNKIVRWALQALAAISSAHLGPPSLGYSVYWVGARTRRDSTYCRLRTNKPWMTIHFFAFRAVGAAHFMFMWEPPSSSSVIKAHLKSTVTHSQPPQYPLCRAPLHPLNLETLHLANYLMWDTVDPPWYRQLSLCYMRCN